MVNFMGFKTLRNYDRKEAKLFLIGEMHAMGEIEYDEGSGTFTLNTDSIPYFLSQGSEIELDDVKYILIDDE